MKLDVLSYYGDPYFFLKVLLYLNYLLPFVQIGMNIGEIKPFADQRIKSFVFQKQRHFIKRIRVKVLDYASLAYIAEQ